MRKKLGVSVILITIVALLFLYRYYDWGQYLTFEYLKANHELFQQLFTLYPLQTSLLFSFIYITTTALSVPGATVLTLASGAIFGLFYGTIIASFSSTIGATLAFLATRFLFRSFVENKFGSIFMKVNKGLEKEGSFYLFSLRMIPLFPFFAVNALMGLTKINVFTFSFVSQIGMLAGTFVYVNAGTQLVKLESIKGIFSLRILMSFSLLGVMPFFSRWLVDRIREMRRNQKYKKPEYYDYNVVVIGAGAAGLVSAYIAAAVKAKVALIEKHKMGGDCLNTGCVPSKALIKAAKINHLIKRAKEFGINAGDHTQVDFSKVMDRVQTVIQKIEPHDSVDRYKKLGVNCYLGEAEVLSPYEVRINQEVLKTRSIIIASGARPLVPTITGLEKIPYSTSDTIWKLRTLPKHLLILGGGAIGCELAQSFSRLGSEVTIVERNTHLMSKEDIDISTFIEKKFTKDGIKICTSHKAIEFRSVEGQQYLVCEAHGKKSELSFDHILLAMGRRANVTGFGLEKLNLEVNNNGTLAANEFLQSTNYANIYVCGDVAGPYQFTHTASHQAWFAAVNALFGVFKKFKVDYRVIPWCTFTDPEVARVGLSEREAKAQQISYELTKYGIDDLDRAITEGEDEGFVKILTKKGTDQILGATIVGSQAGELITEFVSAMKHGYGLNKILSTIHIYPTFSEANKYVAGTWRREHTSQRILWMLEKFHKWRR